MWDSCAITNVDVPEILKASHIKPWKDSNDFERLDPNNGILLIPNLDSLFDSGFITFKNDGQILISSNINNYYGELNLSSTMKLKKVFAGSFKYLEYHRAEIFQK
jgi:putative restriction endonuclease